MFARDPNLESEGSPDVSMAVSWDLKQVLLESSIVLDFHILARSCLSGDWDRGRCRVNAVRSSSAIPSAGKEAYL